MQPRVALTHSLLGIPIWIVSITGTARRPVLGTTQMGSHTCFAEIGAPSNSRQCESDDSREIGSSSRAYPAEHCFHRRQLLHPCQRPASPWCGRHLPHHQWLSCFPYLFLSRHGWLHRGPPAPAAASSLVDVAPPALGDPTDHATLDWSMDTSAPCPHQADKLDQILAMLSQQTALAIQRKVATSKQLDHLEAELERGRHPG